jgi:hypothetical protein
MIREHVIKILLILESTYPSFYKDLSENHKKAMVEVWLLQFINLEYKIVYNAVMDLISICKFPPTIAEIKQYIAKETNKSDMTAAEAWSYVYKAICNSLYNASDEFNKLPNKVKIMIGSPTELRRLATNDNPAELSIYQKRFLKEFSETNVSDVRELQIKLNKSSTRVIEDDNK